MQTITVSQFKDVIRHIVMRQNRPVMGWGRPGEGKTEGAEQAAQEENAHLVDIRLGQYDSVDLKGMPDGDRATNTTVWYMPSTLPFKGNPKFNKITDRPILLVFDEINGGVPSTLGVTYQIIQERRCGEHELMDNVRIVAMGNRETDRGVTNRMPTPLANRLTHFEVQNTVEDWTYGYAIPRKLQPEAIAFLHFRKNLFNTFDDALPKGLKAFGTARSWTTAFGYDADPEMPLWMKHAAMAGVVGDGSAAEYLAFKDVWSKVIPIKEIIKDPMKARVPGPEEASMSYAMAVSVSGSLDVQNVKPLHAYISRFDPEYTVLCWQLAVKRDQQLETTREFIDFAKKHMAIWK
jgi:hypothetical protein